MNNITMKQLPIEERPQERLLSVGPDALSNAELLAIILKTGTREETVLQVAQNVLMLDDESSLFNISKLGVEELMKVKGIGITKAVQIKAVFELAKRISKPKKRNSKIRSAKDVYELLKCECINETKEKMFVLSLNIKNELIKTTRLAIGGNTKVATTISDVLIDPIKVQASGVILVHNHPSGDTKPSKADINFTYKLCEGTQIMGITLLDHIVISDNGYTSLKENGIVD